MEHTQNPHIIAHHTYWSGPPVINLYHQSLHLVTLTGQIGVKSGLASRSPLLVAHTSKCGWAKVDEASSASFLNWTPIFGY